MTTSFAEVQERSYFTFLNIAIGMLVLLVLLFAVDSVTLGWGLLVCIFAPSSCIVFLLISTTIALLVTKLLGVHPFWSHLLNPIVLYLFISFYATIGTRIRTRAKRVADPKREKNPEKKSASQ